MLKSIMCVYIFERNIFIRILFQSRAPRIEQKNRKNEMTRGSTSYETRRTERRVASTVTRVSTAYRVSLHRDFACVTYCFQLSVTITLSIPAVVSRGLSHAGRPLSRQSKLLYNDGYRNFRSRREPGRTRRQRHFDVTRVSRCSGAFVRTFKGG